MKNKKTFQDLLNMQYSSTNIEGTLTNPRILQNAFTRVAIIENASEFDFRNWVASNADQIEKVFLHYRAILFRNFNRLSPENLQHAASMMSKELLTYTEASTPRKNISGKIYTSTEYPKDQHIPMHNEHSYSEHFPKKIWFCCQTPPAQGGETPIADSRAVYQKIDPAIRDLFIKRKILYVRNYGEDLDLPWQTVFGTGNKSEVEAYCKKVNIAYEWIAGNQLRTKQILPAVLPHPDTGEFVWFNQAHLFHVSSLEKSVGEYLIARLGAEYIPRNTFFGDGTEISSEIMNHIKSVYEETALSFSWNKNDLLMMDNIMLAHGRNPFEGPRLIHVAMADAASFTELAGVKSEQQKIIDRTRKNTAAAYLSHDNYNLSEITVENLKYRLSTMFRMFALKKLDDGISGHITVRIPGENSYWMNPLGYLFEEITPDHLIKIDNKGEVREGDYPINVAGFAIHSAIYGQRPDIRCIIHTHSPWGTLFSTLNKSIEPLDQNSCMFFENHALYEEFHGAANDSDEAERIRAALKHNDVLVLKSHGTITCGQDIESATMLMIHIEEAYRLNYYCSLAGGAERIAPAVARATKEWIGNPLALKIEFDAMARKVEREFPDLKKFRP